MRKQTGARASGLEIRSPRRGIDMTEPNETISTTVAIVGSGPSGLALAIELGSRGIDCVVIERNDRVGYAPRAKTTNVRTRTHLRRWGIADRLAAEAPFGIDYPSNVHFVTRLGGQHLATIENASNCAPSRCEDYPEHGQWVPQYKLEQVMRAHADTLPSVQIRFNSEFLDATQDEDGVTLTVRGDGREMRIAAKYLVGADGARSRVRDMIGAEMKGDYGLSRNYNIVFRAPGLAEAHPHGPGTMFWQVNPENPSLVGPMDSGDIWFFMPTRVASSIADEDAADRIRAAIGIDLSIEILSSDEWVASSLIADRYRQDRIFLIGDACHLHPPFGGYGMNMGVADGVDLGWKLAAACEGWGSPAILDTYEIERRPVHMAVLAEASANHAVLSNDLWNDDLERVGEAGDAARRVAAEQIHALKTREFRTLGTVLGGGYANSPIIAEEPELIPLREGSDYQPTSRPGALAPHFWLSTSSIYDHFGPGFALLCRPDARTASIAVALDEARAIGIDLRILKIGSDAGLQRYSHALTLVRPDQYVAWRGNEWSAGSLRMAAGWKGRDAATALRSSAA